ncbi:MAG TPA: hypothetical protein VIM51_13590 [Desulfosporosinus sp.]
MFKVINAVASSDENGSFIGVHSCREHAIQESPVKRALRGFCIAGDTKEEDIFAIENTQEFYYSQEHAEADVPKLLKAWQNSTKVYKKMVHTLSKEKSSNAA